jgi:hypothetical protein
MQAASKLSVQLLKNGFNLFSLDGRLKKNKGNSIYVLNFTLITQFSYANQNAQVMAKAILGIFSYKVVIQEYARSPPNLRVGLKQNSKRRFEK